MVLESKIIVFWTFWYQTQLILGASKSWNFTISVTMWHVTQPILNEIYYLVVHGWHRWVFHKFHLLGYFPPPHEYWWFKVVSFRLVHQQQRLLVRKVEHLTHRNLLRHQITGIKSLEIRIHPFIGEVEFLQRFEEYVDFAPILGASHIVEDPLNFLGHAMNKIFEKKRPKPRKLHKNFKINMEQIITEGRLGTKNKESAERKSEVASAVRCIVHWALKG